VETALFVQSHFSAMRRMRGSSKIAAVSCEGSHERRDPWNCGSLRSSSEPKRLIAVNCAAFVGRSLRSSWKANRATAIERTHSNNARFSQCGDTAVAAPPNRFALPSMQANASFLFANIIIMRLRYAANGARNSFSANQLDGPVPFPPSGISCSAAAVSIRHSRGEARQLLPVIDE
jgi:hypothetical protein